MSNLARIERSLAVLTQEVRNLRSDVSGLRHDLNEAQREYRDEIKALRGDLALSTSRQNSALSDAKKNSAGWPRSSAASTSSLTSSPTG